MRPWLLLTGLILSVAALPAQTEFPGTDDKWRHFDAPNFDLYSRNSDDLSRDLLHNLELLRAFFLDTLKLKERRRLEVTVYYFKSEKDFRTYASGVYGAKHQYVGFYVDGVDRAVIYLIPGSDPVENRRTIFHEYIHHLFRVAEQDPPAWLNEGMAELFSTVTPKAGKLEFGHPVEGRLWQAQSESLLPLEQLFAVDHASPIFQAGNEHTGLFYAESWALVHYLYFGDSKIPVAKRRLFLELAMENRFRDAADMRSAFRDVFGMDYPAMLTKLESYLSGGGYYWGRNDLPDIPAASTYAVRPVPREEIRVRLAELAFRVDRSPLAKLALLQTIDREPADTRALEALGADALRDQDEMTVRDRWGRAVEAGTHNAAIYRQLGVMESREWFARFDVYFRLPAEKAAQLRGYLLRAIEYNPEQTDAYEMLAWVEAFSPEPSIKNLSMIQKKYPVLSRKDRTALALAFVRVRFGNNAEALEMLAGLETMHPDAWETYAIEATRAFIEKRPIDPAKVTPPAGLKIRPPLIRRPGAPGG